MISLTDGDVKKSSPTRKGETHEAKNKPDGDTPRADSMSVIGDGERSNTEDKGEQGHEDDGDDEDDEEMGEEELGSLKAAALYLYANDPQSIVWDSSVHSNIGGEGMSLAPVEGWGAGF